MNNLYRVFGYLFEESLSRVWQHAQPERGYILASAFRGIYSEVDNMARHNELKRMLKERKAGYFVIDGVGKENEGTPEEREVSELSVFIPYTHTMTPEQFLALARDIRSKFDQDFVMARTPDMGPNEVLLITRDGENKAKVSLAPDKVATYYSRMRAGGHKGRPFTFVYEETEPCSWSLRGVQVPDNNVAGYGFMHDGQLH